MFSSRTGWDTAESSFAGAIRRARRSGKEICDLTVSNPTLCGFRYETEMVLRALADAPALVYGADPVGLMTAREAVCRYHADHGAQVQPDQVVLTASTSEAYGFLFRLLCDAGDEVLVARPGYPLFGYLADLEDVRLRSYALFHDFGWWIDFDDLERQIVPTTKALVVVHPANPTGHWTSADEWELLEELCLRHGLALIVDEVFLDYPVHGAGPGTVAGREPDCLTFVLSGLSKVAALPQMKVAWITLLGAQTVRNEALRRLEVIADTFLSVSTPAQVALPSWLAGRRGVQEQILARVRENVACAGRMGVEHYPVEAGWSLIPRLRRELGDAEQILEELGILLHPGHFYGLEGANRAVVSLITPVETFARGMRLLGAAGF